MYQQQILFSSRGSRTMTMKNSCSSLLLLAATILSYPSAFCSAMTVAVTGTTGRLGRQAIQILSSKGISTRCLLRHPIDASLSPSIEKDASSSQVASYLANLPHVTMVEGDATDVESCKKTCKGLRCNSRIARTCPAASYPIVILPPPRIGLETQSKCELFSSAELD
mmetsp:Transcript_26718/g.64105  ORF Transcript_26718/g.64105 Transcript_26718/m.64105 type:complete len:167 (+) Transcript_26718:2-502(+)